MASVLALLVALASASSSTSSSTSPASAAANPLDVSRGTCYAAPGVVLDERFFPCGNAAYGTHACCWHGDNCLVDGACFGIHSGSYLTYLAGCTDAAYGAACPDKGAVDDAWLGLAYCNGSSDQWVACRQTPVAATPTAAGPCACPASTALRSVGLHAGPTLPATASLPWDAGDAISWLDGYTPTADGTHFTADGTHSTTASATQTQTQTGGSRPPATVTLTAAPALTTATAPTPTGATTTTTTTTIRIAIGTAVGVGTAVLLALVAGLCWWRRKQRHSDLKSPPRHGQQDEVHCGHLDQSQLLVCTPHDADGKTLSPTSELGLQPARPWSLRSELEDTGRGPVRSRGAGQPSEHAGSPSLGVLAELSV